MATVLNVVEAMCFYTYVSVYSGYGCLHKPTRSR